MSNYPPGAAEYLNRRDAYEERYEKEYARAHKECLYNIVNDPDVFISEWVNDEIGEQFVRKWARFRQKSLVPAKEFAGAKHDMLESALTKWVESETEKLMEE